MLPCFCRAGPSLPLHWPPVVAWQGLLPCDGFSHRGTEALGHAGSVVVAHGALEHRGSVVVAQGLCFSLSVRGLPRPGSNPCLLKALPYPRLAAMEIFFLFSGRLNDFSLGRGASCSLNHWVRSSHHSTCPFPPAGDAETPEGIVSS